MVGMMCLQLLRTSISCRLTITLHLALVRERISSNVTNVTTSVIKQKCQIAMRNMHSNWLCGINIQAVEVQTMKQVLISLNDQSRKLHEVLLSKPRAHCSWYKYCECMPIFKGKKEMDTGKTKNKTKIRNYLLNSFKVYLQVK